MECLLSGVKEDKKGIKRVQSSTHNGVKVTAQHQVKSLLLGYQSTLPTSLLWDNSCSDVFGYTINKMSQPFVDGSLDPSAPMLYAQRTPTLLAYTKKIIPNVDNFLIHPYSIYNEGSLHHRHQLRHACIIYKCLGVFHNSETFAIFATIFCD